MKHYRIEPTYKKSVVEWTLFQRKDENGIVENLRKELGWRWGSWMVSIPETQEELDKWIENHSNYDTIEDWAYDYGHADADDDGNITIDGDIFEILNDQLLPSEDEESVDITEDYDMEMLETWDGCWEYFHVDSWRKEIPEDEAEALVEEAQDAYEENCEEGVEELGWEYVDTYFEMHCSPRVMECDENGNVEEEDEE